MAVREMWFGPGFGIAEGIEDQLISLDPDIKYDDHVERDVITGRDARIAGLIEVHLRMLVPSGLIPGLDPVTARLMAAIGVDPLALAWVSHHGDYMMGIATADGADAEIGVDVNNLDSDCCGTSVSPGPDATWFPSSGGLYVRGLPDSVLHAVVGERLRDVASVPVLDDEPLRITGLSTGAAGFMGLLTDFGAGMLRIDELARISAGLRDNPATTPHPERRRAP